VIILVDADSTYLFLFPSPSFQNVKPHTLYVSLGKRVYLQKTIRGYLVAYSQVIENSEGQSYMRIALVKES
jgi:hypothetical protein